MAGPPILNEVGTDLNVIVGLCVGHDIAFTQHSKAPVTTLIVLVCSNDEVIETVSIYITCAGHGTPGSIISCFANER